MTDIRDDMVGGLTTMIAEQAALPGMLTLDAVTFDNEIEWQCTMADPATVTIALEPCGGTALLDAIGFSVNQFGQHLAALVKQQTREVSVGLRLARANQDAVLTGATLGFDADSSHTYSAAPENVGAMNKNLSRYVTDVRSKTKRGFSHQERKGAGEKSAS